MEKINRLKSKVFDLPITPEQDAELVRAFPKLYRVRHTTNYGLRYGFDIEQGWYDLIWRTSALLEACIENLPPSQQQDFHALQVKQKFGGLRLYMNDTTPEMDQIIEQAYKIAESTCEYCGQVGVEIYPPDGLQEFIVGWRQSLCPEHFRERALADAVQNLEVPERYKEDFNRHFGDLV